MFLLIYATANNIPPYFPDCTLPLLDSETNQVELNDRGSLGKPGTPKVEYPIVLIEGRACQIPIRIGSETPEATAEQLNQILKTRLLIVTTLVFLVASLVGVIFNYVCDRYVPGYTDRNNITFTILLFATSTTLIIIAVLSIHLKRQVPLAIIDSEIGIFFHVILTGDTAILGAGIALITGQFFYIFTPRRLDRT